MPGTDDLVPLLAPPPSAGLRYGQGRLLTWNRETFENQVEWQGVTLTNLPVHAGVDALTFQAGDVVSLNGWAPGGGTGSWWIAAKVIIPGSDAAEQAISFLRTNLANQIARAVFAESVFSDSIDGQESTSSTSYTNLPTVGPTVADVQISESGLAIVFTNAGILGGNNSALNSQGGDMSFEVTGATAIAATANNPRSSRFGVATGDLGDIGTPVTVNRAVSMAVVDSLNPGPHTFQAKYRAVGSAGANGVFNQRSLVVIAL